MDDNWSETLAEDLAEKYRILEKRKQTYYTESLKRKAEAEQRSILKTLRREYDWTDKQVQSLKDTSPHA